MITPPDPVAISYPLPWYGKKDGCGKMALPAPGEDAAAVFVVDGPWVVAYCSPARARAKRQWPWCDAVERS